jgi:hypothetical protein
MEKLGALEVHYIGIGQRTGYRRWGVPLHADLSARNRYVNLSRPGWDNIKPKERFSGSKLAKGIGDELEY